MAKNGTGPAGANGEAPKICLLRVDAILISHLDPLR